MVPVAGLEGALEGVALLALGVERDLESDPVDEFVGALLVVGLSPLAWLAAEELEGGCDAAALGGPLRCACSDGARVSGRGRRRARARVASRRVCVASRLVTSRHVSTDFPWTSPGAVRG